MIDEQYRDNRISAALTSHGGKVYLIEMTLWRYAFRCDRFKKVGNLYRVERDQEDFGFSVDILIDDELGLESHMKDNVDIWITPMFPQLKNKTLFNVASVGKEEFAITVIDKDYYSSLYPKEKNEFEWMCPEYPGLVDLNGAVNGARTFGEGWRLPSQEELLDGLKKGRFKVPEHGNLWSRDSLQQDPNYTWTLRADGLVISDKEGYNYAYYIRKVKK